MLNTSDNMAKSFRAKERRLCAFWSSSLITGPQHFHLPSQEINVVVMFQEHQGVVADITIT
jgi:hypothetical protein